MRADGMMTAAGVIMVGWLMRQAAGRLLLPLSTRPLGSRIFVRR